MESFITLRDAEDAIKQKALHHRDAIVPKRDIAIDDLENIRIGGTVYRLREQAQSLLCNRYGIPHSYMKKCSGWLQYENLKYWLDREKNSEYFVRFDGDNVRAIFTPRYRPADNTEVIGKLYEMGFDDSQQVRLRLNDEFMSLDLIDTEKTFDVSGDYMTPGISISNSEVGLSGLNVTAYVLRLVCTNGLIAPSGITVKKRHVSDDLLENFPTYVEQAYAGFKGIEGKFKISLETEAPDPEKLFEKFNAQLQLSKNQINAVAWAWPFERGGKIFHIVQTYTRSAQKPGLHPMEAHGLEEAGGKVLRMVA